MITHLIHGTGWSEENVKSQLCFSSSMNILRLAFVHASLLPIKEKKTVDFSPETGYLEMGPEKVNSVPAAISSPSFVQMMEAAGRASEEHSRVPTFNMMMIFSFTDPCRFVMF